MLRLIVVVWLASGAALAQRAPPADGAGVERFEEIEVEGEAPRPSVVRPPPQPSSRAPGFGLRRAFRERLIASVFEL